MAAMTTPTALIAPRWILTMADGAGPLENHAVVLAGDRIQAVLPLPEAQALHPGLPCTALPTHAVMPGLVNTHTHAAMTLMRGLADDLPLMRWLEDHIWPAERTHATAEFVKDGTTLAIAESLLGGVTCLNDMYFFPEEAAAAALETGMRMALGIIVIEFPTRYASDPQDYLDRGLAMRDRHKHDARLSFCLAPHAPYTVSDPTFERVAMLAEQLDLPIHLHLHETEAEIQQSVAQYGCRPIERLSRLGFLGPRLMAVHAVHLLEEEIRSLAHFGCTMVHCPSSNLKLASGFAPVGELLAAGVNVALGTDGAASNNRLDMFEEMRLAAFLAKATTGDAAALPAEAALRMATICGARALGLDDRIGSLEPGKQADIIAVDLDAIDLVPCYHPASHLVYAAGRRDVSHVWIGGEPLVRNGELVRLHVDQLRSRVQGWHTQLFA